MGDWKEQRQIVSVSMSYCLNPNCQQPHNLDQDHFCRNCGSKLLLKERYRAIQPLGEGGFGRTFLAVDEHRLNDPCVIKQFLLSPRDNPKEAALFNQEAVRLYELGNHPQIPDLLAHFEQDNRLYLVQEFIDGLTLLDELEQQGPFDETQIREVLAGLLPVLKFIHEQGVIHRDIKPENIIRRRDDGKLVLIDFGISKQFTGDILTRVGTIVGTPGYAPLEQLRGQACPASDLYSLGVTCISLMTDFLPNESGIHEAYDAFNGIWDWREILPIDTYISGELEDILDNLLQEVLRERYQSAEEVMQDLYPVKQRVKVINDAIASDVTATCPESRILKAELDYRKLDYLLASGKWKEADEETCIKLLKATGREEAGWFRVEDFNQLSCSTLYNINTLWVHYSKGRFGFTVQRRIWENLGGKPGVYNQKISNEFGDRVGWRVNKNWRSYKNLIFTRNAPPGHLPGKVLLSCVGISALAVRLESCNID